MRKHFSSFFNPKHLVVFLALLIMISTAIGVGYFLGLQQATPPPKAQEVKNPPLLDKNTSTTIKETQEVEVLKEKLVGVLKQEEAKPIKQPTNLPKLVIIMDDVSYDDDVRAIRSVGVPLVMSFLPPVQRHPDSAQLAQGINGYMVHLPLEAMDFKDEEDGTLRVGDSVEKITQTIQKIKKHYPNVRYTNNHTGSKFTSDKTSMEKLISVLDKEGIIFVDSRTIGTTKAPEILEKQGRRYLHRDVFLDHHDGVENVKAQIREAVETAKRNGFAVAIGHPRPDTIAALKQSRELLKQVQLVGIDKI